MSEAAGGERVLFGAEAIAARVEELAGEVRRELDGVSPTVVGILTGSFVFVADFVRALTRAGVDPEIDFLSLSLYRRGSEPGEEVRLRGELGGAVRGRTVVVVDDILDTGYTLDFARRHVEAHGAAAVHTCVLLDKPSRRRIDVRADHVGFVVPDVWIYGYGLDLEGRGRGLPYLAHRAESP